MTPEPGDVYWVDLDGGGRHMAIVVSRELFNDGGYVTVVPVTSEKFERKITTPKLCAVYGWRGML